MTRPGSTRFSPAPKKTAGRSSWSTRSTRCSRPRESTRPVSSSWKKGRRRSRGNLAASGRTVVLKIVSPLIHHKTDVGGVPFVENRCGGREPGSRGDARRGSRGFRTWAKKFDGPGGKGGPARRTSRLDPRRPGLRKSRLRQSRLRLGAPDRGPEFAGVRPGGDHGGGRPGRRIHEREDPGREGRLDLSAHLLDEDHIRTLLEPLAFYRQARQGFPRAEAARSRRRGLAGSILRFVALARALFALLGEIALRHRGGRGQSVRRPRGEARAAGRVVPVFAGAPGTHGPAIGQIRKPPPPGLDRHHRRLREDEPRPYHPQQYPEERLPERADLRRQAGSGGDRRLPVRAGGAPTCPRPWTCSS